MEDEIKRHIFRNGAAFQRKPGAEFDPGPPHKRDLPPTNDCRHLSRPSSSQVRHLVCQKGSGNDLMLQTVTPVLQI